jgi:hypothetical protein
MRRITDAIAVLLILGLAAVGFSSAQKKTIDSSSATVVSDSPAASTSEAAAAALRRTPDNPVSEHFQTGADGATTHSAEPTRMAEATTAPVLPNTPAPSASAQNKPAATTAIPPCDKPGGIGLSRIVEIDTTGGPASVSSISSNMTSCATRKSF